MRHHFIRNGFLNELFSSEEIRQTLWADLSTDEEFAHATVNLARTLDKMADLLHLNHRRDLVENVGGSLRVRLPPEPVALSTQLDLALMHQALVSYAKRWDSARDRTTTSGGEVHEGIRKWVLETAPAMPWLIEELVEAFRQNWLSIVLNYDAAVLMEREIVIPPPTLLSPIEIQLRFEPGVPLATVEEELNVEIALARAKIAEAKKAWGPMPAKTSDTLETWGRWACRVVVFKRSIRSVALEHFRTADNPESRIKDVRDGVRKARESLESEVPPNVRVLTSFG